MDATGELTIEAFNAAGTVERFRELHAAETHAEDRRFLAGVLSQFRFWTYHNAEPFQGMGLFSGGHCLAMNVSYVGKQKRGRWGRYVQSHYAYTTREHRRRGLAKHLFRHCEGVWIQQGAHRLKDLIGSWLGVYLHRSLGHTIWGLEKNGHLIIDHPLVSEFALDGVPTNVTRQAPETVCPLPYDEGERLFGLYGKGKDLARQP